MSKITFEQAWAAWEAKGFQYGEDALEQVRFGWDIALSHSNEVALREQIVDLELKLAATHLKVTLLQIELEKSMGDVQMLVTMLSSDEPYDGYGAELKRIAALDQRSEELAIAEELGLGVNIGADMDAALPPTPESLELDQVMEEDPQLQEIFEENSAALDVVLKDES